MKNDSPGGKTLMRTKFKIDTGDYDTRGTSQREIKIVGTGKNTYLWIGGDGCFGYKSGPKTLEALAKSILKALKAKP
jgi:hypothetical protein